MNNNEQSYLASVELRAAPSSPEITLLKYFRNYISEHLLKAGENITRQTEVKLSESHRFSGTYLLQCLTMKVLNEQELQIAEEILLKNTPRSLVVYGLIHTLNRNKASVVEVVVDTWPDFKVIICRPDPQFISQEKLNFNPRRRVSYYCTDEQILRKMLTEENVVDFSPFFRFIGCDASITDIIKEVSSDKGLNISDHGLTHLLYLPDCSTLIRPAVDSELESRVSSLNLSHLDLVNQAQNPGGGTEDFYKYITHLISNFPSCCITDEQGQPVSWVLMRDVCSMGMLYTVPEHRGKGYAKVVIYTMAKRLQAEGFPVFCLIKEDNLISYRLFTSMGFIENPSDRFQVLDINY